MQIVKCENQHFTQQNQQNGRVAEWLKASDSKLINALFPHLDARGLTRHLLPIKDFIKNSEGSTWPGKGPFLGEQYQIAVSDVVRSL
jgi:hypothetical protein